MEEDNIYGDEGLEALLHHLRKEDPNIQCPSGKKITKLCVSRKCQNALRCDDLNCQHCGRSVHKSCGSVSIEEMTFIFNEKAQQFRQFVLKMIEIEQEFMNTIRRNQKKFIEQYALAPMKESYKKMIDEIYAAKNYKALNGEQACSIIQTLQTEFDIKKRKDQLEKYRHELHELEKHFEHIKKQCLVVADKIQEGHVHDPSRIEIIIEKKEEKKAKVLLQVDSKVLRMKGTVGQDIEFLQEKLNNPKQIQLAFRASEHQFSAAAFHDKCNNIDNALVMIRTQFGKTIGGFTQYKCHHQKGDKDVIVVHSTQKKSFLLQFDLKERMDPVGNNGLISCHKNYGPVFGGAGADLLISDKCNVEPNSSIFFPNNYNGENKEYPKNQETLELFTGNKVGNKFRVDQYEVYRVIVE